MPYLERSVQGKKWLRGAAVRPVFYGLLFLLVSFSPLYVIQSRIKMIGNNFDRLPYFIHQQEIEALEWLRKNSRPGEGVFSGDQMGNLFPAFSGNKVFTGHYCLTPDYQEKLKTVKAFWDQNNVSLNRMELLRKQGIQYVYQGVEEKAMGSYDPSREFPVIFSNNRSNLYRVE